ncbi:peptidylprolyl isomerase [Undibacterium sp. Dicai25W]|uniref:peptidylprolyl isomerase n=1 Tax=Undibacterium sp. Dicai25W TaxID=3413034 RepID=UPI003BF2A45F
MKSATTKLVGLLLSAMLSLSATQTFADELPKVSIKTNLGEIVVELYPEAAPKTVDNFIKYVKAGQYKGTIFHRVIDNFMIQGGGYDKNMKEKPTGKPIASEAALALEKGVKNDLGTIAMARTEDPNSATAQFFINVRDNDFLNHQPLPAGDPVEFNYRGNITKAPRKQALIATAGYTPFGKVIKGMDVVEKIKAVETSDSHMMQNVPKRDIIIESATVIK